MWNVGKRLLNCYPTNAGRKSSGTQHTTNRFPCNKKASLWKEKREVTFISATFPLLIPQQKQVPSRLLSQVLIPTTEDNRELPVLCSFVTAGKSSRPKASCEEKTFSYNNIKFQISTSKKSRLQRRFRKKQKVTKKGFLAWAMEL